MPPYFPTGHSWATLTRSERSFCAALYRHELANPGSLHQAIRKHCKVPPAIGSRWSWNSASVAHVPTSTHWEVGLEACFFRDMHKAIPTAVKPSRFNSLAQTTFDLALFSDTSIIILEAKGIETFSTPQLQGIETLKSDIKALCGKNIEVYVFGLISSKYYLNISKAPITASLHLLDGLLSWSDLANTYGGCPVLARANSMYKT